MAKKPNRPIATDRRTFLQRLELMALWIAMVAALIQVAVTFLFNVGAEGLPLTGSPDSVAVRAMISTLVITVIVGPVAYIRGMQARNLLVPDEFKVGYRLSVVPMTLAAVMLFGLTIAWSFALLDRAFPGVTFDRVSLVVIMSIVSGIMGYVVASRMALLRAPGMLYLGIGALFGTLIFSGARNEDPYWWENSFSHLGMTLSNSKAIFNIGLIFTGILIVVWQQFFMTDVKVLERRKLITHRAYRIFNVALILVGVMLALVGLVRFGISPFLNVVHDVAATGTGVILGLLMLTLWKLNRHYLRVFYYMSALIVAAIIGVVIANVLGYVSLTGLEMYCFVLASLWLVLFFRNTELLIEQVAPESHV